MNFFDYVPKNDVQVGRIWGLFDSMSCDEINRSSYAYSLDIIRSALAGNIKLSEEGVSEFPLKGYSASCARSERITRRNKVEKELFIVEASFEDDTGKVGFGDVPDTVLKDIDDMFDMVVDDSTFEKCLLDLMGIRSKYIITEKVDLVELIKRSLKGVQEACDRLARLIINDKQLKGIIDGLLNTGHEHDLLARLEMEV